MAVVGIATVRPEAASLWYGSLGIAGTLFLLAVIARQPQTHQEADTTVPLMPWLPAATVLINTILCSQLLATVWPAAVLWIATGVHPSY
jgi:cationic amino acid transporter 2